jgi:alkyl sulfatase BDS1-like metallo-beta-lactamase superfamily hydrolase
LSALYDIAVRNIPHLQSFLHGMTVRSTILHIPGETDDQIGVWIPESRTLLCADDIYKAFPNLYAIRGTPSRDLMQWVDSLDLMLSYEADFLVPSHTRPIIGRENIKQNVSSKKSIS